MHFRSEWGVYFPRNIQFAESSYAHAFQNGYPIDECNQISNELLFEGLDFSRFDNIFHVHYPQ
nr:DUF1896 family protein [uncultured Sphingobacterium sp.]